MMWGGWRGVLTTKTDRKLQPKNNNISYSALKRMHGIVKHQSMQDYAKQV